MPLTMVFEKRGREVGREDTSVGLAEAQNRALLLVEAGRYSRVRIWNERGRLVGEMPPRRERDTALD